MTDDFPVLTGIERARFQEHAWATAMFTWALSECDRVRHPDTRTLLREKLDEWEPHHKH